MVKQTENKPQYIHTVLVKLYIHNIAQQDLHVFFITSFGPLAKPLSDLYNVKNLVKYHAKHYMFMQDRYLILITNTP